MATQRERRVAAEILRRIVESLPEPTPVQTAYLLGTANGLDGGSRSRSRVVASRPDVLSLDHVQLAAPPGCEVEARRFYGGLLGLVEVAKPEALRARGGVWFSVGSQQLHIGVDASFSPARKAHPALRVAPEDLDALASRLEAKSERVTWDERVPGVRRLYTEDPWGNRVELLSESRDPR